MGRRCCAARRATSTFTPNQARVGGVLVGFYSYVCPDAPRTYGVRVGVNF